MSNNQNNIIYDQREDGLYAIQIIGGTKEKPIFSETLVKANKLFEDEQKRQERINNQVNSENDKLLEEIKVLREKVLNNTATLDEKARFIALVS